MKARKTFQILGTLFVIGGVIFLLTFSMIVTGNSKVDFSRDLFGFPIPHPPVWTSFIPYLGPFLGFIFELFSVHGLIVVAIFSLLLYIGGFFLTLGNERGTEMNKKVKILTPAHRPDFGLDLKKTFGGNKNSHIHITDAFVIENLIMFPNNKSSITGRVDDKVVSFDFEDDILKMFLWLLADLKVVDRLDVENKIREQQDQPISFTISPVLVTGMVLSCKFGQIEKSETTDEEFIPLIIESAKIVQHPVAVLVQDH